MAHDEDFNENWESLDEIAENEDSYDDDNGGWDDDEAGWGREVYFDENGIMVDPSHGDFDDEDEDDEGPFANFGYEAGDDEE